jgi:hypothetical protein
MTVSRFYSTLEIGSGLAPMNWTPYFFGLAAARDFVRCKDYLSTSWRRIEAIMSKLAFAVLGVRQVNFFRLAGALLGCLLMVLVPVVARADGIVLTIDTNLTAVPNSPNQQQVAITGSVQNNFPFSLLTSLSLLFPDTGGIICSVCSLSFDYNASGGHTIAAGGSTGDITLATLTINPGGLPDPSGLFFLGHFTIFSGNGPSNTAIATVGSVPEPSSFFLLCTGVLGILGAGRRGRFTLARINQII